MKYLTAVAAAERLGRTERTIRRWIEIGKLPAHHIASNRLAIAESDVEQLERELEQFEDQEARINVPALAQKLEQIEQKVRELERLITPSILSEDTLTRTRKPRRQNRTTEASSDKAPPVSGALLAKDFARLYSVNENTFRDHVRKGVGPSNEKAPTFMRDKPNRPGEKEYWILPERAPDVLRFWDKYGVRYTLPEQQQLDFDQDQAAQEQEQKESED